MFELETFIKAGAATGDGYGPAPCRRSNRGNIVSTSYTTSTELATLNAGRTDRLKTTRVVALLISGSPLFFIAEVDGVTSDGEMDPWNDSCAPRVDLSIRRVVSS
jgi:hypothetical protein